jgi:hypothetical protein
MLFPDYMWEPKEVMQVLTDIGMCVKSFTDYPSAFHHLGAITLLEGFDATQCLRPVDRCALPQRICTVLDGQQRLATLALIACLLHQRLGMLREKLLQDDYGNLREHLQRLQAALRKMFACEVPGVSPQFKPILIHGRTDFWTNTEDRRFYRSAVGEFLYTSLNLLGRGQLVPVIPDDSGLVKQVASINQWLDTITTPDSAAIFPTVWQIRSGLNWLDYQLFAHGDISVAAADSRNADFLHVGAFVKLFALSHTLLQRCCFTVVSPTTPEAGDSLATYYRERLNYY